MYSTTFTRRFCAAHRVAQDPGACQRIHGHNYEAQIVVTAPVVHPTTGFVVPADEIKRLVDELYDHRLILEKDDLVGTPFPDGWVVRVPATPSTENLAQWIATGVAYATSYYLAVVDPDSVTVVVELRETPTIMARASTVLRREDPPIEERFLGRTAA